MRLIDADNLTDDCKRYLATLNPNRDGKECTRIRWLIGVLDNAPSVQPEHKIQFADKDHVWIDSRQYISLKRLQEIVTHTKSTSLIERIRGGDGLAPIYPSAQPERKTGMWIETEGLDEEIRCIMCSNPMKTNRGCDGLCRYNEHLYHEIISVLENRITKVE